MVRLRIELMLAVHKFCPACSGTRAFAKPVLRLTYKLFHWGGYERPRYCRKIGSRMVYAYRRYLVLQPLRELWSTTGFSIGLRAPETKAVTFRPAL